MQSWVSSSFVSCLGKHTHCPPLILLFITLVSLFQTSSRNLIASPLGETAVWWTHFLAGIRCPAKLQRRQCSPPYPSAKKKRKNPPERKTGGKKGRGEKNESSRPRQSNNKAQYEDWEVDVRADLFVLVCSFMSCITMTSFQVLLATIPLIIMQKLIVWVSIFPWVQQNTLHYTPENVIPLLCYAVT